MMEQLSSWLKGIILVILFATFIDLLLPSQKFSRVVKMATGLVIILAMLSPVLNILGGKMDMSTWLSNSSAPEGATLDSIRAKAAQLEQRAQQQTQEEWKLQLSTYLAREVESLYPVSVSNVEISFTKDSLTGAAQGKITAPKIQSIRLYVAKRNVPAQVASPSYTQGSSSAAGLGVPRIAAIAPIKINGSNSTGNQSVSSPIAQPTDPEQERLTRDMKSQLATHYELSNNFIQIIWG